MKNYVLSKKYLEALANPATRGQRHGEMVSLAIDLITHGFVPDATCLQIRVMYEKDVTDAEINEWNRSRSTKFYHSKLGWAVHQHAKNTHPL